MRVWEGMKRGEDDRTQGITFSLSMPGQFPFLTSDRICAVRGTVPVTQTCLAASDYFHCVNFADVSSLENIPCISRNQSHSQCQRLYLLYNESEFQF